MKLSASIVPTPLEMAAALEFCARELAAEPLAVERNTMAFVRWRMRYGLVVDILPLHFGWYSWSMRIRISGPENSVFSGLELGEEKPLSLRDMHGRQQLITHIRLQEELWASLQGAAAWPVSAATLFKPLLDNPQALVQWNQHGDTSKLHLGPMSELILGEHAAFFTAEALQAQNLDTAQDTSLYMLQTVSGMSAMICEAMVAFERLNSVPAAWDRIPSLRSLGQKLHLWATGGVGTGSLPQPTELVHMITSRLLLAGELEGQVQI